MAPREKMQAHFDVLEPLEDEQEEEQIQEEEQQIQKVEGQKQEDEEGIKEEENQEEKEKEKENKPEVKENEEEPEDMQTESEEEVKTSTIGTWDTTNNCIKKRGARRSRLSVKKATTIYKRNCGICGEQHMKRRASVECVCRQYVHLACLGYKPYEFFAAKSKDEIACKCKSNSEQVAKATQLRQSRRMAKISRSRSSQNEQALITAALVACAAVVPFVATEFHLIQLKSYVRMHGLKKAAYNGLEGQVVKRENEKAEVELAGTWQVLRVHCKHLTLLPTFRVSRCRLRGHCTVQAILEIEPVWGWPENVGGTYYDVLQVASRADKETIKASFRKLSVALHPDKNPSNVEKATRLFKQILEAYECLKDDAKRATYDQRLFASMYHQQQMWNMRSGTNTRAQNWPWG